MICKFCGNVIEDNSDYCFICGQKVVSEAPAYAAEVYSNQPQGAPAQPVYAAAPAQPVYAAPAQNGAYDLSEEAPYEAPAQPVYAPPVAPAVPQDKKAAKAAKKAAKKADKAAKKAAAPAGPDSLSKGAKIITAILAAIFLAVSAILSTKSILPLAIGMVATAVVAAVYYKNYKKALDGGYENKASEILNTGMIGLCVGMGVAVLFLVINFVIK